MHIRVLLKLHWNMRNNKEYCKDGASKQYSFSFTIKISLKSYHEFGSAGLTYFGTHELQR